MPAIYWEHTTRRVLTMEYVEGVKITDVAGMRAPGHRPGDVAKILVVAFGEMLLQHGLFHADPHPGNLLVAPGPKLILVDFGQVKEIGPQFRFVFAQMTRALLAEDDSALGRTFRDLGFRMKHDTDERLRRARQRLRRRHRQADDGERRPAGSTRTCSTSSYRESCASCAPTRVIKIPPDLLFVGRVMGLLNGLSMTLHSRTNLLVEMARLLDDPTPSSATATRRRRRRSAASWRRERQARSSASTSSLPRRRARSTSPTVSETFVS